MNDPENTLLIKKKIINYSIIIGIILIIAIVIVVVIVVIKKNESQNSEKSQINPSDPWNNLIPTPSEEKMRELIQNSYNIVPSMTQSEIQEILLNDLYQIIRFTKGIYNLDI